MSIICQTCFKMLAEIFFIHLIAEQLPEVDDIQGDKNVRVPFPLRAFVPYGAPCSGKPIFSG